MVKRREFALAGIAGAALAGMGQLASGQEGQRQRQSGQRESQQRSRPSHQGYSDSFERCAAACSNCQRECSRCSMHCANLIGHGHDEHHHTLRTCLDCADFCAAASRIVARGGPFAGVICDACAEACRRCGEACREHNDDPLMRACADECFRCEQECRNMTRTARRSSDRDSR